MRFVVCLTLCHFILVFFSPFSIAITSLGEERANLSAFRTFDQFMLVWVCRFPLPLGVWEGLRVVVVALPGLFSYRLFFNSTSRYLDDLLNIDNIYFDQMVDRIYPTELQLNRANSPDIEAPFLDLNLCISNGTFSTKIYEKRDDFDFDVVNFPFLDGDVPRRTSYAVYISQLIRFARASSNLNDFNYRNKALTAKLLWQGYRYFKLRKAFSKFYRRHSALLEKI